MAFGAYRSVYIIRRSQRVRDDIAGASIRYGMDTERAGYCAALGRIFASFFAVLVIPDDDNFNQRYHDIPAGYQIAAPRQT